ncbi:MAG: biopolymer transporter ExbD, partial [Chloroflexi bacterium]|nr:biopolymer transporter ExbD [Chloroflexota bacterium]
MKKKKEIFWEINMVPFNDILLVLLIIFMMTASFIVTGTGID